MPIELTQDTACSANWTRQLFWEKWAIWRKMRACLLTKNCRYASLVTNGSSRETIRGTKVRTYPSIHRPGIGREKTILFHCKHSLATAHSGTTRIGTSSQEPFSRPSPRLL